LKNLRRKKPQKKDREKSVLLGLVELYIKTGIPIGSNTLKMKGFEFLSSATIRNYFAKLEKLGYLKQQHLSGGRIPTSLAYREYANSCMEDLKISSQDEKKVTIHLKEEYKNLSNYLHSTAELISELSSGCVFLLFPKLEQDFIQNLILLKLDDNKLLCVIITDFGQIKNETLQLDAPLSEKEIKEIQQYLLWRISKTPKPNISQHLIKMSQKFYNEIMLRHVATYSNNKEEITYRTGLSKLLSHKEFQDPLVLAKSLSLFEDSDKIKSLLTECIRINRTTSWIGQELAAFGSLASDCSIVAFPYKINQIPIGAIAILVPKRSDYAKIFGLANHLTEHLSIALTKNIYKFKINFQPKTIVESSIMLEDKSKI
jgi:heat-inducible transcriptional repressor